MYPHYPFQGFHSTADMCLFVSGCYVYEFDMKSHSWCNLYTVVLANLKSPWHSTYYVHWAHFKDITKISNFQLKNLDAPCL